MGMRPNSTALSEMGSHLGGRSFHASARICQLSQLGWWYWEVRSILHVYVSVYRCTLSKPIFAEYLLPPFQTKMAICMGRTGGGKRTRYETMPSTFSAPLSHWQIFIFSITSLQGGPHNWGHLCPQMNGKPATPLHCCQQHYQEGGKRTRYETMPSTFSAPLSH
jgi:hypothetical protein